MASDPAPEAEALAGEEQETTPAGRSDDAEAPQPKGGKKKRTWQKVKNVADFYNPAPYTAQKGSGKGGGKGGKGGKGGGDGEGGCPKGKGKGKDMYSEVELQKPQDDGKSPGGAEGQGSLDGDPMQPKGFGSKSKKQGGKNREGKGKGPGKAMSGAPRKGAKGAPRGPLGPGEPPEPGADAPEGPRPPGPQRMPAPVKGGACGGGMGGGPMGMAPYSYGTAVPYPYGPMPYAYGGMPAMYAVPYCVLPSPSAAMNSAQPYMAGGPQASQSQAAPPADRQGLVRQVHQQIEYYFATDNLIKDLYLRSSLMTQEGWVPIPSIASFRKVSEMTHDMSIITDAISSSEKLEMDPQRENVRLKENWQEWVLSRKGGLQPAASAASPTAQPS